MKLNDLGDPFKLWRDHVTSADEEQRRVVARQRSEVYHEEGIHVLAGWLHEIYDSMPNREDLLKIARRSQIKNLLRRISDEIALPLYSRPVRRLMSSPTAEATYTVIADDIGLDAIMGELAALTFCHGNMVVTATWSDVHGFKLRLLEPHQVAVYPSPEDPLEPLAVGYHAVLPIEGRPVPVWVVYDGDEVRIQTEEGRKVRVESWPLSRPPFVFVSAAPPTRAFWVKNANRRLVDATIDLWAVNAQMLAVLRDQGHIQMTFEGDADALPVQQTLGTKTILRAMGATAGGQIGRLSTLDLQADLASYMSASEKIESGAGADYGFSLDRLNQRSQNEADDAFVRARTEKLQQSMRLGEAAVFRLTRDVVNAFHPSVSFAPQDELVGIDYPPIPTAPTVRKSQLETRELELRQGTASPLDFVFQDNAEIRTREEAVAEYKRNVEDMALLARMRMQNNLRADANVAATGQDPEANGAMGPAVRDGKMSRDDAAAKSGRKIDVVVKEALRGAN